ncbi:protein-lysine N-methyltransferase EEF2KMT-like [Dendronephthya gigantea]|uniref:protein-lysine N-methyltransferase EEF2KMT-like n=1 Tax=Dendronephthya gigantea TaxID=151771 RepID=UPI001069AF34|nr:protein-lysine N-methyltransferase EEF2KMT-like [Dendronephthya gigantea]
MADLNDALCSVQKQYFQVVGMKFFDWEKLKNLTIEETSSQQIAVLNATVFHPLSQKYPPSDSYKLSFLKSLLAMYENQGREACDDLYSLIGKLMAEKHSPGNDFIYKSYIMVRNAVAHSCILLYQPCGQVVTLCESKQVVSQGTTGLNTWQAGMYLSNWVVQNKNILEGKNILELGCGVGLLGLVSLHSCNPQTYTFTDRHEQVLNKVIENLKTNGFSSAKTKRTFQRCQNEGGTSGEEKTNISDELRGLFSSFNGRACRACNLQRDKSVFNDDCCAVVDQIDWERCSVEEIRKYRPDVILASDVIFDPSSFETLVKLIKVLLSERVQNHQPVAYIASTIRNKETFEKFLLILVTYALYNH